MSASAIVVAVIGAGVVGSSAMAAFSMVPPSPSGIDRVDAGSGRFILGAIGGLSSGSIAGGIIAACGIIPAAWAAWAGMQQETQKSLAGALAMVFVSLAVGGLLLILGIIDLFR